MCRARDPKDDLETTIYQAAGRHGKQFEPLFDQQRGIRKVLCNKPANPSSQSFGLKRINRMRLTHGSQHSSPTVTRKDGEPTSKQRGPSEVRSQFGFEQSGALRAGNWPERCFTAQSLTLPAYLDRQVDAQARRSPPLLQEQDRLHRRKSVRLAPSRRTGSCQEAASRVLS